MEQTEHKQHIFGVTVSHHSQLGLSSCRKMSSGLPLILHYGEWYNYFIIEHNSITMERKSAIIIEIKGTISATCLNHIKTFTSLHLWKKLSSTNWSLVQKSFNTAVLRNPRFLFVCLFSFYPLFYSFLFSFCIKHFSVSSERLSQGT